MTGISLLTAILLLSQPHAAKHEPAKKGNSGKKTVAAGKPSAPRAKPRKTEAAKPDPKTAKPSPAGKQLEEADATCRKALAWGRVQAVRDRCSDLEPKSSPIATFWRLSLSDDPNDLRKGFAPQILAKSEVDSRLLLAAGRYHFARGQRKELDDLVEIARKEKIAGKDIDTLKRLATGG